MGRYEHNLPSVLNPMGDICVRVYIPAHPDYIKLFLRAVRQLEVNRMYQRDEDLSAKIVVEQWRNRTVTPLIEALANGTGLCDGLDGECIGYPPFANFFSYFPQNPYTEPDFVPPDFLEPPFYINGKDNEHTLPTHEKGDVIVAFGAINLEPSWNLDNTPRIELCLEGSGVAELHLLNVVQGGVAIVSLDNPVDLGDIIGGVIGDNIDIIDLNQDIVSLPPETAEEIIIEVEVPEDGEHIIYIYFLPTVNDSLIPLAFGGGIRSVSLCGSLRPCGQPPPEPPPPLEGVTELRPAFQFTADCGLEYRLYDQNDELVQDWTPVEGWTENAALCFAVGGGMSIDYEAWYDANRRAIYDAVNDIAKQVVSGRVTNIAVGEDGTVSDPTTSDPDAGIPPDDPETVQNESLEAKAGGAGAIRLGMNLIWSQLSTWYTGGVVLAAAQERLKTLYTLNDAETDTLVSSYYNARQQAQPYVQSFAATLDAYMFCKGQNINTLFRWIYEIQTANLQSMSANLAYALTQEQINNWFDEGTQTPSTDYIEFSCTKFDSETIIFNNADLLSANFKIGTVVNKINHRVLLEVSGLVTDSVNGEIEDFFYRRESTGAVTKIGLNASETGAGSIQINTNWTLPSQLEVPFEPSGVYRVTRETYEGQLLNIRRRFPNATNGQSFTLTITDLGEILT